MTAGSTAPTSSITPKGLGYFFDIVIDCADAWRTAKFWAELIGSEIDEEDSSDAWVQLTHRGTGPRLAFQRVEGFEAPSWPDGVPQQMHFDIAVEDVPAAEERILELGATILSEMKGEHPHRPWRVYADPAGHPFCLVTRPDGFPIV